MMENYAQKYKEHIEHLYPILQEQDGISDATIRLSEQGLGFNIPLALREFYLLVGNRKDICQSFNILLEIENIEVLNDMVVFFRENQGVVIWGIRWEDVLLDDPEVFIAENRTTKTWISTNGTVATFLISMIYWQSVNGGLPYIGLATKIDRDIEGILVNWVYIALESSLDGVVAFFDNGKVICTAKEGGVYDLYAGSSSIDGFMEIERLINVEWDYSTINDE
jgi:hypothetical protein